ncbi:MAG: AI-2E family transporter [Bacteroidaceae bacterium]
MFDKKITFDGFIRTLFGAAILIALLCLVDRLSGVLLPFFLAWLIAYFLYPLVKFFQYKLRLRNRALSIAAALLTVSVVGVGAFWLFVPPLVSEFVRLKELAVIYFVEHRQASALPADLAAFVRENIDLHWIGTVLTEERVMEVLREALPRLWQVLAQSVNVLFSVLASFVVLLYVVFILLDYESISDGWLRWLPAKYRGPVSGLVFDIQEGMNRYFRGQAFVAFCVGVLFSIGFLIIDFPLAIGLGLFIGLLNLVPYLQIAGFVPTVLLALLKAADTGQNFWLILLAALAVFAVVQAIQDFFIVPRVMGKITGLNPAVILLSLSVWGSLMGVIGMIIALPLTTLVSSYYRRYVLTGEETSAQPADNQSLEEDEENNQKKN